MKTINLSYATFTQKWYEEVENVVLGTYKFNEEQKKFIHYLESSVIEAGPGSGKTTALSAKVGLLIKRIEEEGSQQGICVITHTNAAVNEILKVLNKLGYKNIPHPHFIGTINEFFNRFGMYPYLKIKGIEISKINFVENDRLVNYFKSKLATDHRWLNSTDPKFAGYARGVIRRLLRSHLYLDKSGEINAKTFESGKFDKYKSSYLKYKKKSWKEDIFHVNDTFYFAQIFFEFGNVKRRLRDRFSYILMDEYQDVAPLPLTLLKNVFLSENNVFQMIGDSRQHIAYSNPEVCTNDFKTYYLNQTNRFGNKIAKVLNNMFNSNLTAAEPDKSLRPVLYLYQDTKKIKQKFSKILNEYKILVNHENAAVLVAARNDVNDLATTLSKTVKKDLNSNFQIAKQKVNRLLAEKTELPIQSVKKQLQEEYITYDLEINKALLDYFRGLADYKSVQGKINLFLINFGSRSKVNNNNNIFKELDEMKDGEYKINQTSEIPTKTIHDLKGQTLTANLVYYRKGSREEYGFLNSYTPNLEQPKYYDEINKRVAFVAMSRATTLLVVALNNTTYNNLTEEARLKLDEDFDIVREEELFAE